ncbi:YciI family protein [Sediminibacterium sp. TEGAF015]|uniref:YciI family protein n=1 Tax=Sediminibacterium sp. TEGAF015 TaxID=575378 RepID=UPI002202E526|nr:hypothetical protein [Sediminibacterium sp. TEGAF015]BDQ11094.1 hypothetical protein TEGAF0_03110 [Sediminibacterium sp. TEGAF015]
MRCILFLIGTWLSLSLTAQSSVFDESLAKKLGADDYGMKQYMLVILKTGNNTTQDKKFIDSCFSGHMSNMNLMVKADKLVVAGPIGKNEKMYRGIFILNVATKNEAEKLLKTDPAVNAGLLDAEYFPWYGSAALATYLPNVEKVTKKNF